MRKPRINQPNTLKVASKGRWCMLWFGNDYPQTYINKVLVYVSEIISY